MAIYFISDLHLEPAQKAITDGFLSFLDSLNSAKGSQNEAEELYILGDFFEVWIGDDYSNEYIELINQALQQCSNKGTKIYFMHGNRDFLVGKTWCDNAHCELLDESKLITLGNESILLMHGDSLCTDDVEYMKARVMLRNPQWQEQLLAKTIPERIEFAKQVRSESKESQKGKSYEIMDVNQTAVDGALSAAHCSTMIHGHTHRPNIHHWDFEGEKRTRYVLGDWGDKGWFIKWQAGETLKLESFDL
ncbi:MAG TPA: UDP-2,3-diacylglucosamine diphosphatase [Oceanospirillales bacterium]|nr:UDP-2,3-diacylglucosamine diphosphatase [Oceanospirillales bacterium]|tara:strand:- start:256 stop:999 length:744 start_codon:yes stop_codon:yes gene_type:complete